MPTAARMKCTCLYHDTDVIELRIAVGNGRFCGAADVYVGVGQLLEVSELLQGFPKHSKDTREVTLGAFGSKFAGGAARLEFYCRDLAGHAVLRATIEADYELEDASQSAVVITDIEPAALDIFLAELQLIEKDLKGSAELKFANV
jgi:hypothetical protein